MPRLAPLLRRLAAAALAAVLATPALAEIRATDITGRAVVLDAPAQRIVLGEGRHMGVLAMLHENPVALVAGWRQDKALDPVTEAAYAERFPGIADIPAVGAGNRQLSVESVIALQPDLVLLALVDATDPQMAQPLAQLQAAGIPYAFVDFFAKPMQNSLPSLAFLGAVTGAEARAAEFAGVYQAHLARITDRLAAANPAPPRVFVQVHAGPDRCCPTVGAGVFDDFVTAAGGHNIGRDLVPGVMGNLSLESLIAADPDVYLATGGQHMAARGGLVLGAGYDAAAARASLAALVAAPGLSGLRAVEEGRALGIWHMFNDSLFHIALIERLAQLFHPDLFADLDPEATMRDLTGRFAPVQVPGTWWVTLK